MAIDLKQVGIDIQDPAVQPLLSDLQGNILKTHGRQHSAYLVVTFRADQSRAIRRWIRDFATYYVTTATEQIKDAQRYRDVGMDAGLFGNLYLSAKGYEVLGFREDQLPSPRSRGKSFAKGMKAASLKDPEPEHWEEGYRRDIHALLFLADDDPALLDRTLSTFTSELEPLTERLTLENGVRWFAPDEEQDIEPFGFADGISQPLFLKKEIEHAKELGNDCWDPSAPLEIVLVKDPHGVGEDSYGSFFVFRKLEQDVAGFHRRLADLAQALGTDTELAGAYVVGRFRDGTPVVLKDRPGGAADEVTNFNFADDMAGSRCPFQAHIRKTNPRGDTVRVFEGDFHFERNHRIVRRGVPFGKQPPPGMKPTWPVGLLFTCFQSDIGNQFELMQTSWANSLHFVRQKTGLDPIIGQGEQLIGGQGWPKAWGDDSTAKAVPFDFSPYVALKGGEYFFAPSRGFLTSL